MLVTVPSKRRQAQHRISQFSSVSGPPADSSFGSANGWDWDSGENTYTAGSDNLSPGTVCAYGNISVSGNPGTPAAPLSPSLIATGSVQLSGNPFITADHSEGVLIIAGGDLQLNGNAQVGSENMDGLIYGGSQCQINGTPVLNGQFLCLDRPDPPGALNLGDETTISGDATLNFACRAFGSGVGPATPFRSRWWTQAID